MIKFKEFNRKWYPIVEEIIETLTNDRLLNIKKETVRNIDNIIVSTDRRESVIPDMIEENLNLNLYTVHNIEIISTSRKFKSFLKNVVETIISKILMEKEEIASDIEYKILVELMMKTVLVGMDDSIGPIFQVEVRNSYINVYPKYLVMFSIGENGERRTVKSLSKKELAKQLLGEFRRQVKLKDKWVPMSYELYKDYSSKGLIKEVNLKKRLSLLEEKAELVARFEMDTKKFVRLFTIFSEEDIDKMSMHELTFIRNSLMQLNYIWRLIKNNKKINIDNHIPPYFKVNVKFM